MLFFAWIGSFFLFQTILSGLKRRIQCQQEATSLFAKSSKFGLSSQARMLSDSASSFLQVFNSEISTQ